MHEERNENFNKNRTLRWIQNKLGQLSAGTGGAVRGRWREEVDASALPDLPRTVSLPHCL